MRLRPSAMIGRCLALVLLVAGSGFACPTAGHAATPPVRDVHTVRIGIDRSNPPFSWIDPDAGPQGFDVAIAKALCARMQVKCEFVADTRDALVGNLLARRSDAVVASLPITDAARKLVDFTNRYEALASRFVVTNRSGIVDPTPEAMKDKIIGVIAGARHIAYLDAVYAPKGAIIRTYASDDALHADLRAGRIQATLGDAAQLYQWFDPGNGARCCRFAGGAITNGARWLGEGAGIAVRREDAGLREAINKALADLLRDGSYEKLNAAYLPFLLY